MAFIAPKSEDGCARGLRSIYNHVVLLLMLIILSVWKSVKHCAQGWLSWSMDPSNA